MVSLICVFPNGIERYLISVSYRKKKVKSLCARQELPVEGTGDRTDAVSEEKIIRREIIALCQKLHDRNLLAAADGNVSFRLSDEKILITPSGKNKAFLQEDEIAVVNLANDVLQGEPSSERLMHLELYRYCPKALAVIHAHPPTAIAWTIARPTLEELPCESLSEIILAAGRIPIVRYARPGTVAMGRHLEPFLPGHRILILSRHGAITWGESLLEAYNGMERLEHSARILKAAHELGGLHALPSEEVQVLRRMRKEKGERLL